MGKQMDNLLEQKSKIEERIRMFSMNDRYEDLLQKSLKELDKVNQRIELQQQLDAEEAERLANQPIEINKDSHLVKLYSKMESLLLKVTDMVANDTTKELGYDKLIAEYSSLMKQIQKREEINDKIGYQYERPFGTEVTNILKSLDDGFNDGTEEE